MLKIVLLGYSCTSCYIIVADAATALDKTFLHFIREKNAYGRDFLALKIAEKLPSF